MFQINLIIIKTTKFRVILNGIQFLFCHHTVWSIKFMFVITKLHKSKQYYNEAFCTHRVEFELFTIVFLMTVNILYTTFSIIIDLKRNCLTLNSVNWKMYDFPSTDKMTPYTCPRHIPLQRINNKTWQELSQTKCDSKSHNRTRVITNLLILTRELWGYEISHCG